ncbi:MAG TPA: response regulator [bacterium]|jgi:DNA-binding NtrC family response regulator|nr:response regulator [bacterium]HOC88023.1 response regulator [bacterium]HOZ21064.1 response regulator [bacterium]
MKIVIYNDELRSGMQMYLALSNRHDVRVAQDVDDLFAMLDQAAADLTILDLVPPDSPDQPVDGLDIAHKIQTRHPQIKLVGVYDQGDQNLVKKARANGIVELIARPIKNRELLGLIEK